MEPVTPRPALDVSGLPTVVFGGRSPVWLATVLFMLIEGAMVAMLAASYFYLRTRTNDWPPGVMPPALTWGVANGILFLVSIAPAWFIQKRARAGDLQGCRLGLVILTLVAAANIVLRCFEFPSLNCAWQANAYASTIWLMLGVHSTHLLTDFIETVVLTVLAFSDPVEGKSFTNFDENSLYWYFVVGVALAIDFIIYGTTRMF